MCGCVNVWACVRVGVVMFGCFGNTYTCIYCLLYFSYYVFCIVLFMNIYSYLVYLVLFVFESHTRSETQIETKLDQPPRKNGQHQTPETRPQLQTSRKKRLRTPEEVKRPNPWRKMMMMMMMVVVVVCFY